MGWFKGICTEDFPIFYRKILGFNHRFSLKQAIDPRYFHGSWFYSTLCRWFAMGFPHKPVGFHRFSSVSSSKSGENPGGRGAGCRLGAGALVVWHGHRGDRRRTGTGWTSGARRGHSVWTIWEYNGWLVVTETWLFIVNPWLIMVNMVNIVNLWLIMVNMVNIVNLWLIMVNMVNIVNLWLIIYGWITNGWGNQHPVTSSYHPTNTQLYTSYISAIHQLNTSYTCWLVVWNMAFMTFHSVGNFIIPTDELIFFRGVGWNHQPDGIHRNEHFGWYNKAINLVFLWGIMGFLWNNLYNNGISWYNHQTIWEYIGILIPGNTNPWEYYKWF